MISILDPLYLGITAIITVCMQLLFFGIAAAFRFDKVTDIAGSMNFAILAVVTFCLGQTYYNRQLVVLILTLLWSFRLGLFLLYRVLKRGKDDRFDQIRNNFFAFLGFWIFQMVWVWTVSLPVTLLNAAEYDVPLGVRDFVGYSLWGLGFVMEAIADQTKYNHTQDRTNNSFLRSGLWGYSRHPNYFGEIMCWLGIFLSSSSVYSKNTMAAYVAVLSPMLTAVLLLFVSGAPGAEKRSDEKYHLDPQYIEYKQRTSPIIPLPPLLYANLPMLIKKIFFFEIYGNDEIESTTSIKTNLTKVESSSLHSTHQNYFSNV